MTLSGPSGDSTIRLSTGGPGKGDTLYLYKEKDEATGAGIYAVCEVTGRYGDTASVRMDKQVLSNKRQFLRETTLLRDPGLGIKKSLLSGKIGAVKLSKVEALRLRLLAKKAGKDFDAIDSMRCLLAYEECIIAGLNIDSSDPVKNAALETGRLLSSVSFKLANFRSLDPRTESAGFDGVAEVDRTTWNKYYDNVDRRINMEQLRLDLSEKEFHDPDLFIMTPAEAAEDDIAPRDDEDRRQIFARRVRRGQSRFRKALLTLYSNQCAFTGVREDRVLEACHVLPHAETGNNQLDNGLILRADIHTLFDLGLATVANDGITVRLDTMRVTDPEFTRLNNVQQRRAAVTERHREILSIRNRDIAWLS
ncbi:MAG: HNH endonuclease [Chthoniobacteraceae bacterium]|nr:HNH endonuclease [Chthoniobacteraceae bacterium]